MLHRLLRNASISSVLLTSFFGLVLFTSGCGSSVEGEHGELSPVDKKNIEDEQKALEDAKTQKEQIARPSA